MVAFECIAGCVAGPVEVPSFSRALPDAELNAHIGFTGSVVQAPDESWLVGGYVSAHQLKTILDRAAPNFRAEIVLDFGCGSGRTTRFLPLLGSVRQLYGCDIDAAAIGWLNGLHPPICTAFQIGDRPPFPAGLPQFDLILAQSVFTHLPLDLERLWLAEIAKAMKPGGIMALTFHGPGFQRFIPPQQQREFSDTGFMYTNLGLTPGLPEFYQTSFHSLDYIRREWAAYGQVLEVVEYGLGGQDVALIQKL